MDLIRDYGQDRELAKQFFREFVIMDEETGELVPKYNEILTKVANREAIQIAIELADLEKFNPELTRHVIGNTVRYTQIFYQALDEILPSYKNQDHGDYDIMDVFIEQRSFIAERNLRVQNSQSNFTNNQQRIDNSTPGYVDINGTYPPELIRRAEIVFKPVTFEALPIRDCRACYIGKLVTVRGIVTRTTDVKPQAHVVCYTCDQCGCESFQVIKGQDFTPLFECTSAVCKANKVQGRVVKQDRGSKMIKFQEIKLQEHSDQVPTGHIPRAITIFAHGEQTRKCSPGDHISVTGVFLTIEKNNYRMRSGGLSADTYIEAHYITQMNKTEDDELNIIPMSHEEATDLVQGQPNFLGRLSKSLAPEIYGHEDLKVALLLLLVGGVDRNIHNMKIRGNINICLMGDPGVAKSQLLSFIDRLAPRSQYTTGRGSSGVGLTAAILKDPITNELTLEGGALVLADKGICCIDEFDKMMDADRTAIHEVMEQQTVSIAKAGIMTTLNARVSILAAANPAYGRYNLKRSISDNLDLPPALLSRFDLLWLIKDKPDESNDLHLANHIFNVHTKPGEDIEHDRDVIDMKSMRRYIQLCKLKNPIVPPTLDDLLVRIYNEIRSKKRNLNDTEALFTSPRSLLAIIRMSTAFARLRLSDTVEESDINAAYRLYNRSRESIEGLTDSESLTGPKVMQIIRELTAENKSCLVAEIMSEAESLGLKPDVVNNALDHFQAIESISIEDGQVIRI